MNQFRKQFHRKPASTCLLVLLLTVAIAFCTIGFSTYLTVQRQMHSVDSQYTTIAIPSGNQMDYFGFFFDGEEALPLTEQTEREYPGLLAEDMRGFLTAHVTGCESVSYFGRSRGNSNSSFDAYNNSMMVLAVRCAEVVEEELSVPDIVYQKNEAGEVIGQTETYSQYYRADFTIEEPVCRLPAYDALPQDVLVSFYSRLHTADGKIPFEPGKTYLLFGMDMGATERIGEDVPTEIDGEIYMVTEVTPLERFGIDEIYGEGTNAANPSEENHFFSWEQKENGDKVYRTLKEDSLPFYAEYEGDWRDFLETEDGKVWRDEVIPWCELNHESASVILTDNIDSMLWFNNGSADILEGRKFEKEEYGEGRPVCMVSGTYAAENNLSLGDTVHLEFYQSRLYYQMEAVDSGGLDVNWEPVWVQAPCSEENRIGVEKDYTIVGIYTAPEFATGWHSFQADTIFVPKASVPDAEKYEDWYSPLLYTIILENGREEEFEEALEGIGYGGLFTYYDQSYNTLADSFEALSVNAMRLALAGLAVFILAGVMFLFLNIRRVSPVIRNMRLLGIRANVVWKELLAALSLLIGISAIAGAGLGYALYGTVTAQVLEKEITVSPWMMLLCAAVLAVVMLLAAAVTARVQARKRLMSKRKK